MASLAAEPQANHSRILTIRFPSGLQEQLEALANRDANSISSVVRRLVTAGLRAEQQQTVGGAR